MNFDGCTKYACKYIVENFIVMKGYEKINMNASNILSIEYVNDYEFNVRAMLKVTLRIDGNRRLWMIKNRTAIRVKFELLKVGMDLESESFITTPKTVWNNIFQVYFNEDESIDDDTQISINDLQEEDYFDVENTLDMYLFESAILNASNNKFNAVFTQDILQNCVGRLLTKTKHKKVLISPFENDEVYDELIVPELPAYSALIYLDQYYGFYKTGALIYYDIDTTYILNTNGKLSAKRDKEIPATCFYITPDEGSQPGNGMIKKPGNVTYVTANDSNINTQLPSIAQNETTGSDTKFIVADDITMNLSEANQSTMNQRNQSISFIRKADNKFIPSIAKARAEENECILYINADNVDINVFTPNKVYQVIYEDTTKNQKYGRYKYRLAYSHHCIVVRSGEYMDSAHQFILKRSADQS